MQWTATNIANFGTWRWNLTLPLSSYFVRVVGGGTRKELKLVPQIVEQRPCLPSTQVQFPGNHMFTGAEWELILPASYIIIKALYKCQIEIHCLLAPYMMAIPRGCTLSTIKSHYIR